MIDIEKFTKKQLYGMLIAANNKRKKEHKRGDYYRDKFKVKVQECSMLMQRNIELRDALRDINRIVKDSKAI